MLVSSIMSALDLFRKIQGDEEVDFIDVRSDYLEVTYVDGRTNETEVKRVPGRREENAATN